MLITEPVTGLEDIEREVFYTLFDNLNGVIDEVEERGQIKDEQFNSRTGRTEPLTTLEVIQPENFYDGHRPSLLKAPIDRIPNISVMAYLATPAPGSENLDQLDVYNDQVWIEIMVKSDSEGMINRRIKRTTEAVNICVLQNRSLNGLIGGIDTAPSVTLTDVQVRKERTAYGPEWYMQGARINYLVRKEAISPASENESIFTADYDQA